MRRSGVRIPLAPPQADIRSWVSVFCMPRGVVAVLCRRWCSGLKDRVKGLKDKTCWFCGDFLACWREKSGVIGHCVLLVARLFGFLVRESRYRRWWHLLSSSCGQRLYINPVILRAGLGMFAWAPLLVVVTRSCAAGPYWWQCGRPAWATTCGVNLRMKGPGYPLVRPILPSLWPMPPSLWAMAPPLR